MQFGTLLTSQNDSRAEQRNRLGLTTFTAFEQLFQRKPSAGPRLPPSIRPVKSTQIPHSPSSCCTRFITTTMSVSRAASACTKSPNTTAERRSFQAFVRSRSQSSASTTSRLSISSTSSSPFQSTTASTAEVIKGLGPLVILIRHFEAECNLLNAQGEPRHDIVDAPLTARGLLQAKKIPDVYPKLWQSIVGNKGKIWTSPITRAVQTTLLGLPKVYEHKSMVKVLPDL